MGWKLTGSVSGIDADVDTTMKALRVSVRPMEVLGWYMAAMISGALTGVAAAGPVASVRNIGTNPLLIRRLAVGFATTTAFTAAQALTYSLFRAQSFTASDTGGNAGFTAGQNKMKAAFSNMVTAPDLRIAAAAALTAGIRTLDTVPMASCIGSSTGVGTSMSLQNLIQHDAEDYPMVLAQNEGAIVANGIAMGAAGVVQLQCNLEYTEVVSF